MTLVPEKLARFRVAVPSEHEAELLAALETVAKVHLEEPFRESSTLPELLVEVLEGRITPSTLNIEEALSTARKILRENDLLLMKLESIFTEYEKLQVLRKLVEQLEALGVSPSILRRELHGTIVDVALISEENIGSAVVELFRIGCGVRRLKLAPGENILILIYPAATAEIVESVKRRYCLPLNLPEWFYDDISKVRNKLEEEELRVRKEALGILLDIASAIRDALEFEKISREEILEKAHYAVENLRKELSRLENALLKMISLHLTVHAYRNGAKALEELGLDKKLIPIVDRVLNERKLEDELVKKALGKAVREEHVSELLYNVKIYNSLLIARQLTSEVKQMISSEKTYCIICGVSDLAQDLKVFLEKTTTIRMKIEREYDGFYAALLEGEPKDLEDIARTLRKRFAMITFLYRPGVTSLSMEKQITDSLSSKKTELLANIIQINVSKIKNHLDKVLRLLEGQNLYRLWQSYINLGSTAEHVISNWYSQLKELISDAGEAVNKIGELDTELSLLAEVPLHELSDALGRAADKLEDILHKVHHVLQYSGLIESSLKARSMLREVRISRERRVTVVEGYIPAKERQRMEEAIRKMVPSVLYFRVAEIPRSETAPTYIETRGLTKYLHSLTSLRGIPSYWEVNPTPFFTVLFVTMYGMMFGDVGQGLVLALFGAWLLKTRFRLLGISEEGAASLGALALLAGISGVVFGALYGFVIFLKPLARPVISPIHDVYEMIAVALCFGVAQLMLALALNVVNLVRAGDVLGAVFSGMGGMGILFYSSGVVIAYHLATSGFNLGVLSAPHLRPLTYLLLISLLTVVGYGLYEWKITGNSEKIMHATSEVIEMLLALPANSLSYIRLAAFAMAHEAFGILAENMSPMAGELAGYLLANFLVFAIEALAVGIQAMRLLYYEFSTKFFRGEGIEFKPLFIR